MKKIIFIILITILYSCSKPKDIKVDSKKANEYVEIICNELDSITANNFKEEFKRVLIISTVERGKATIIKQYSIQYKFLTLGDILNKVQN